MNVSSIRRDFPTVRGGKSVYLDSACESLKPDCVIRKLTEYYTEYPACGGRSVHSMATRVSMGVDEAREEAASFFGCRDPSEFVFTKNCTEGMNIVARGFGLRRGDVVLTSDVEHNSNHVQWLEMERDVGIRRRICPTSPRGEFDMEAFKERVKGVRLVSMGQVSNVTGCAVPAREVAEVAHDAGAAVLIDGAQSAPHIPVDLKKMDADFFSLSVHKMLGPTGVGLLYGKSEMLEKLRPLAYGGGIVGLTTYDSVKYAPAPERFEAGLQDYAGIIASAEAFRYLRKIGMDNVAEHEAALQRRIQKGVDGMDCISIVGPEDPGKRGGVFSFNMDGLSSHDVAMMVDDIASVLIRSGMHCAHPFFVSRGIDGCARASLYIYNDESDVDRFLSALGKVAGAFARRQDPDGQPALGLRELGEVRGPEPDIALHRAPQRRAVGPLPVGDLQEHAVEGHGAVLRRQVLLRRDRHHVRLGGPEGVDHPRDGVRLRLERGVLLRVVERGDRREHRGEERDPADAEGGAGEHELHHSRVTLAPGLSPK